MKDKLIPVLVVLLVIAAFVIGMYYGKETVYKEVGRVAGTKIQDSGQGDGDEQKLAPPPEETQLSADLWDEIIADPAIVKGEKGAKVTIVEFTDYQCPFCARYVEDAYQTIMSDYVDAGKVQYVFRDLPLSFHPNAKPAAMAARCAGDQGKYWEMHDVIFSGQEEWSEGDAEEVFAGYAEELGLNMSDYEACVENETYAEAIDADTALAAKVGASGTPTFFINGEKLVGAQPLPAFQDVIDKALGE